MFKVKTKKDIYNESKIDLRTYICGETSIKPYYYIRNGLLHVRYTVDRCMELSPSEIERIKADITAHPSDKQKILSSFWSFLEKTVGRAVIFDGIKEAEKRIKKGAVVK